MVKVGRYTIYDESWSLDAESDTGPIRAGFVENWKAGRNHYYAIRGDLPVYVERKIAQLAEARGWLFWYNAGRYEDVVKEYKIAQKRRGR